MWELEDINKKNIEAAARNITVDEINLFRDNHPEHDDRTDFEIACMIVMEDKPTPMHMDGTPYDVCNSWHPTQEYAA